MSPLRAFFQNGQFYQTFVWSGHWWPRRSALDKHEREEAFSNDGLDEILLQSLDIFEEVKNSVEDAIDITDMFEFGGPRLVMARCVVGIVDTYMKRCPKDSLLNAFYLKPLQKFKAKVFGILLCL